VSLLERILLDGPGRYGALQAPALDPLLRQCPVHEVGWRGPAECWCCEDEVPG